MQHPYGLIEDIYGDQQLGKQSQHRVEAWDSLKGGAIQDQLELDCQHGQASPVPVRGEGEASIIEVLLKAKGVQPYEEVQQAKEGQRPYPILKRLEQDFYQNSLEYEREQSGRGQADDRDVHQAGGRQERNSNNFAEEDDERQALLEVPFPALL